MLTPVPRHSIASLASILKWNEAEHPRNPAGSGDKSGEFAPKGTEAPSETEPRIVEVRRVKQAFVDDATALVGPDIMAKAMADNDEWDAMGNYSIRGDMKQDIRKRLTARLTSHGAFEGLTEEQIADYVKEKIDLWADTSGDSNPDALRMQQSVKSEFDLEVPVWNPDNTPIFSLPSAAGKRLVARQRAYVLAEYAETQAWFKAKGITHVTVFRGLNDQDDELGSGVEEVTTQPASSWSTSAEMAVSFSLSGAHDFKQNPKVIVARVPVKDVLSTAVTGRGSLAEEEVILLGKTHRAQVVRIQAYMRPIPSEVEKVLRVLR